MYRHAGGLIVAGAVVASSFGAEAAVTRIDLTDEVATAITDELGATITPLDDATFDPATATATFPVTSAELAGDDPAVGRFEHVGSGIAFSDGDSSLAVRDLVIDTAGDTLGGTLSATTSFLATPLEFPFEFVTSEAFALTDATAGDLPLEVRFTPGAASTLNALFGTDVFDPETLLATAGVNLDEGEDVVATPLPAALPLLAVGVGGLAWARRRRLAAA